MALGARQQDIRNLFLLEAVTLTAAVGFALCNRRLGMTAAWLYAWLSGWEFALAVAALPGRGQHVAVRGAVLRYLPGGLGLAVATGGGPYAMSKAALICLATVSLHGVAADVVIKPSAPSTTRSGYERGVSLNARSPT